MNKIILNDNEYEIFYIPIKIIISKIINEKLSLGDILHLELEKQYPFLDIQSQIFNTFAIEKRGISIACVVVEASVLSKYRNKRLIIRRNGKTMRLYYKRVAGIKIVIALVIFIGIFAGSLLYGNKSSVQNNPVKSELILEKVYEHPAIESIDFFSLCTILLEIKQEHFYNITDVKIKYIHEEKKVLVFLMLQGILPEIMQSYFDKSNFSTMEIEQVNYNNNIPLFSISLTAHINQDNRDEYANLMQLREYIRSGIGTIKYEQNNSRILKVIIPEKNFEKLLIELSVHSNMYAFDNFESKYSNGQYELTIEKSSHTVNIFSNSNLCSLLQNPVKQKELFVTEKNINQFTDQNNSDVVLGKITTENGVVKIFYKNSEGKIISEVEK